MTLSVTVDRRVAGGGLPCDKQVVCWVRACYHLSTSASVAVSIVDESESAYLNEKYRQKNYPTNVLSFPMDMSGDISEIMAECLLGDIVICAPIVECEAKQQSKILENHWAHMTVHGMLHLQGYDHIQEKEADEMEALEIKILTGLGFPSPYE